MLNMAFASDAKLTEASKGLNMKELMQHCLTDEFPTIFNACTVVLYAKH